MGSRFQELVQLGFSRQRIRVCRMHIKGKTQSQIARRLNISQQRVSQHLAAAVARFPELASKGVLRVRPNRRSDFRLAA